MDPIASTAVDQSTWIGFGLSALIAFAAAAATIAFGVAASLAWQWRQQIRAGAPRLIRVPHVRRVRTR